MSLQQAAGRRKYLDESFAGNGRDARERRHPAGKQRFGLVDVPNSGERMLVEQRIADLDVAEYIKPVDRGVEIELCRQQIWSEIAQAVGSIDLPRVEKFCGRDVKRDCLPGVGRDDDPHVMARSHPPLAGAIQVPRPVHSHVGVEHQLSGKPHEQMLAARRHPFEGAATHRITIRSG
jgi:hypothetical protein